MPKNNSSVRLIISGGQSGADLAGNEFAEEQGIQHQCYVFPNFIPDSNEDLKQLKKYSLLFVKCSDPEDYTKCLRERTIHNVRRADATIIFHSRPIEDTRGSRLTAKMCKAYEKACCIVSIHYPEDSAKAIVKFLQENKPRCLNIAGERTLYRHSVKEILVRAWKKL